MSKTAKQNTPIPISSILYDLKEYSKGQLDLLPQLPQHPRLSSPKKAQRGLHLKSTDKIAQGLERSGKAQKVSVPKKDRVSHPSYYTWLKSKCGIEVIDITRHLNFNIGNVIKYVLRSGHKQEEGMTNKEKQIEDLQKAIFYLNDEIKKLKTE